MPESLIEAAAQMSDPTDQRFFGVTIAQVVSNLDSTGEGRVQVRLPWMPGLEPWARVASPSAGPDCGIFFIPQADDEVLVAFNHGDLRDAFVIGSLWNGSDAPPRRSPTDPRNLRVVATPAGHEIELDDSARSITITSATGHTVSITPNAIELAAGDTAKVVLKKSGHIELTAKVEVKIEAATLKLSGTTVEIAGKGSATIDGGSSCTVKGGVVRVN